MAVPVTVTMAVVVLVGVGADALHVMVVAFLGQADLGLEAEDLLPVLAELAVHVVVAGLDFLHALGEGIEHQGMVREVGRLDELNLRMPRRHLVRVVVDPLDQDAGEEEVGKYDDPPVAKLRRVLQARLDQGEGDPGIGGLAPAETHALPEHAHHLGDIGVGVGVRGAAPDHDQHGLVQRHLALRLVQRLPDARAGRAQQLAVDRQLASVVDLHLGVLGLVGAEHRGDVVLRVPGGEEHARHGEHLVVPALAQAVEAVADDRGRELQEAALDLVLRQPFADAPRDGIEFGDRPAVPAAVAAHHDSGLASIPVHRPFPFACLALTRVIAGTKVPPWP